MEKTITLDGKKVRLRSTAATPLIYKNQFKKDYLSDLLKLATILDTGDTKLKKGKKMNLKDITSEQADKLDLSVVWQYLWALAKNANSEIGDPIEWLSEFESLDIETLIPDIQELLITSIQSQKK